jgi:hypothetical protein
MCCDAAVATLSRSRVPSSVLVDTVLLTAYVWLETHYAEMLRDVELGRDRSQRVSSVPPGSTRTAAALRQSSVSQVVGSGKGPCLR